MSRGRRGQAPAATGYVDDLVGRVTVQIDADDPAVRRLDVGGRAYGAVDLDAPERLHLLYLNHLRALLDTLLPAGPVHVAHLGGGAFALPRALAARRPELTQVVIERSQQIIDLAHRELGLRPTSALQVVHDDARAALAAMAPGSADAVAGDAFVGRETPRHLATVEFVAEVARVLRARGCYVLNLIDGPPWSALAAHAATVRTALPHLVAVATPAVAKGELSGNVLLVASRRALHHATLEQRLTPRHLTLVPGGRLASLARDARARHDADG